MHCNVGHLSTLLVMPSTLGSGVCSCSGSNVVELVLQWSQTQDGSHMLLGGVP
jgi:hypothetical protein